MKLVYFLSREVTRRWTSPSIRTFSASGLALEADGGGTYLWGRGAAEGEKEGLGQQCGQIPAPRNGQARATPGAHANKTYHFDSRVFPCLFWSRKNRIC